MKTKYAKVSIENSKLCEINRSTQEKVDQLEKKVKDFEFHSDVYFEIYHLKPKFLFLRLTMKRVSTKKAHRATSWQNREEKGNAERRGIE